MRINLNDKERSICVRLSDDMYNSVMGFCDAEMCTMSDFIRISIDAFFQSRNKSLEIGKAIDSVSIEYEVNFLDGLQ